MLERGPDTGFEETGVLAFAGLRRQHDVGISSRAMFECLRDLFSMGCLVIEEHGSRDVRKLSICRAVSTKPDVCQSDKKDAGSWVKLYIPSSTPRPIVLTCLPDIPRYFYQVKSWEEERVPVWSEGDVW